MAEWVILELGPMAEGEDPAFITASIRHLIGKDAEVFIPASITQVGDDRVVTYLVDGYAFVKRARPDAAYFRLDDSRYVRNVVRDFTGRGRSPACVQDRDIEKFRRQIRIHSDQGIDVGDTVMVTSGPYKSLQAVVVEDIPEQDSVQVRIELRSKDSLVTLPRSFLRLVTKAAMPPYVLRTREHRDWFDRAKDVLRWEPEGWGEVRQTFALHKQLSEWMEKGRLFQAGIRLSSYVEQLAGMRRLWTQHSILSRWMRSGTALHSFIRAFNVPLSLGQTDPLLEKAERLSGWDAKFRELSGHLDAVEVAPPGTVLTGLKAQYERLEHSLFRFLDITRSVQSIERHLEGRVMVENVVIDGMNMAVRCSMAPGLGELRDSQGRPTGAIVGFLNSLSSLRKRFPEAHLWVCWDSPSNRRRAQFPDYKANRGPHRHSFEVGWLKTVLPAFGVWQASAKGEEADDVIASLVRGRLNDQHNVIVSNDRDFMQLVTDQTHVLVPAVGAGKERLCTPDVVQAEYGVLPERMVHLRALGGDSSDNIPGAPGCGNKTASKLLGLYGTVDGIYTSNLAGLSPALRGKLRGAERQVRLNLSIMALVTDLDLSLHSPDPDQTVAGRFLDEIEMNPVRVIPAFFGQRGEVQG